MSQKDKIKKLGQVCVGARAVQGCVIKCLFIHFYTNILFIYLHRVPVGVGLNFHYSFIDANKILQIYNAMCLSFNLLT